MIYEYDLRQEAESNTQPPTVFLSLHRRVLNSINEIVQIAAMLALLLAACILTSSVVTRYFLKVATDWQDESAIFLLVGATFMYGAYVQSLRGHVGIEAVSSMLPPGLNRARMLLVDLITFAFCGFFAWKSWTLFHEAWVDGQTSSSTWAPPLWIPYITMAIGMTLLTVQVLSQFVDGLRVKGAAK